MDVDLHELDDILDTLADDVGKSRTLGPAVDQLMDEMFS
jgi:hypothetical protein